MHRKASAGKQHSTASFSSFSKTCMKNELFQAIVLANSDCTNCAVLKVGGMGCSSSMVCVFNFCIYLFNTVKHFVLHFLA